MTGQQQQLLLPLLLQENADSNADSVDLLLYGGREVSERSYFFPTDAAAAAAAAAAVAVAAAAPSA